MFAGVGLAKAAFQVDSPERIPEYMNKAFSLACSGRPGPVVLALPEDVLSGALPYDVPTPLPAVVPLPAPPAASISELGALLSASKSPFLIAGGGGWCVDTAEALGAFGA